MPLRHFFRPVLVPLLSALLVQCPAQAVPKHRTAVKPDTAPLSAEERAQQILDRFTFGPRPGDIAAVSKTGWEAWFDQQLHPESIPDPDLDKRLAAYPILNLTPAQVAVQFPDGNVIRQIANGKLAMPQDPMIAGVYEVMLAKYNRREQRKAAENQQSASSKPADDFNQDLQSQPTAAALAAQILGSPRNTRMQAIMRLPVIQRIILCNRVADPERGILLNDFNPREKEMFSLMAGGPAGTGVAQGELQQAKILRVILSERQLQEVMTDFWFNHFNVYLGKNPIESYYLASYERDAIRAHALGKFKDLLLATAQHPAMLDYLDNRTSIGPGSLVANRARANPKQAERGLNENYGREVMELHTVGVNGGYTQADVTNLAKILTGWTIDHPELGGPFIFDERRHEPGDKTWFGQTLKEDGFNEGRHALLWLAAQPQTASFISYKLAQRFVADEPPLSLVHRMSQTYLSSDGDISEVLRAMVHSPEFWSRTNYRNKVKTPLEFVASAFRATGANPSNPSALAGTLARMGEPLYQMQPPTGYPMTADHWMNSAALVDRLNFSMGLASSKIGGMKFDAPHLLAAGLLARPAAAAPTGLRRLSISEQFSSSDKTGQDEALALMEQMLVAGDVSAKTNAVIRQQLSQLQGQDAAQILDTMTAMILGSPEFQMR